MVPKDKEEKKERKLAVMLCELLGFDLHSVSSPARNKAEHKYYHHSQQIKLSNEKLLFLHNIFSLYIIDLRTSLMHSLSEDAVGNELHKFFLFLLTLFTGCILRCKGHKTCYISWEMPEGVWF